MVLFQTGSEYTELSNKDLREGLFSAFDKLGSKKKVLAIPPDFTRFHSYAGELTRFSWEYYQDSLTDVLPALGTHSAMTPDEITRMFGNVPKHLFRVHDWRKDIVTMGEVPSDFVKEVSENAVNFTWPAQVNKLLIEGNFDLILSIGQVVPHEVVGMANYNKNIFIGIGGAEGINKSHFLGAAYGMERIMGRSDTPVRMVFNYASDNFLGDLPIVYVLTVVGNDESGKFKVRGLYIGPDIECFNLASECSLKINFKMLTKPLKKVVVYLDPSKFKSTWLGNKSIYRTRMAIEDNGELIVLGPGIKKFSEDPDIDKLIRKYGYVGTPEIIKAVKENEDLKQNLSAAAHLIHGSSEGRFKIVYCSEKLNKKDIEAVNFNYANLEEMLNRYDPGKLSEGYNTMANGEKIFFISNPATGLWAYKEKFKE